MAKKRSMGLTPIREYPTYQAVYGLHPQNGLSAEELYIKTILVVADWLRGRVSKSGGDSSFLEAYPPASEYKACRKEDIKDLSAVSGYDIKSVNWESKDTWALRIIEISQKTENQSFSTEITVKKKEDTVILAVRTICREPVTEERVRPADVFRLGFVSHTLLQDPDIIMTEYGVGTEYPLIRDFISINGKSNSECEALGSGLLFNEDRQYPVVLLTKETADRLQEAEMEKLLEKGKCLAYYVTIGNSPQKLVRVHLGQDRLADDMAAGSKAAVITGAADSREVKPFEIFNEEGELRTAFFNEMCSYLQNSTRGMEFDFHDTGFFSEVRQEKLLEGLTKTEDPEKSSEIAAVIEGLQDDLEAKAQNEELLLARITELEKTSKELKERNSNLYRENLQIERLKEELNDSKQVAKSDDARFAEIEERLSKEQAGRLEFIERTRALLNIPVKCTREELVTWIRENYGDRLILHERGERSFLTDTKPRDLNLFCRIIHYLYGYTLCMAENPGNINAAKEAAKAYDMLDDGLDVTFVGKEPLRHYPDDYTIDISAVNPNKKDVLMDKHISIGKGMDAGSVRIYLYYDSETGKSIIGYVYGHLEIGMK